MTVHIWVGVAANHEDVESQSVLEYTLRRHASEPVVINWMKQSRDPASPYFSAVGGWATTGWATPFSGFRWAVPFYAKEQGLDRAIYMDSDFIVFGDIAELWHTEFKPGKVVVAKGGGRYCCSLWSVADALRNLPDEYDRLCRDANLHPRMTSFYGQRPGMVQTFDNHQKWNHLDTERVPFGSLAKRGIKAIHYTRVDMQLQMKHALPRLAKDGAKHWYNGPTRKNDWLGLQDMFDELLAEAVIEYPLAKYMADEKFGSYYIRR